ncbi:MAG: type IV toxin-antitoxin system AbiEi family antitoxin domain-containing protein [Vulcanimicrobiota bacterium]
MDIFNEKSEKLCKELDGRRVFRLDQLRYKPDYIDLYRWVKSGWLKRLANGVYRIAAFDPPDPKVIAALLVPNSYISGCTALEYHGLLAPDPQRLVHSVTPSRRRDYEIEGVSYFFQRLACTQNPGWYPSPTGHFRVATIGTALLDLHYRASVEMKIPTGFQYEKADINAIWMETRNLSQGWKRRLLVRLHGKIRGEQRRLTSLAAWRGRAKESTQGTLTP